MIEPAEEIYVVFNKKTGSIKTGSGRVGQFARDEKDDYAVAKYRLVEAKESRE